MLTPRQHEVFNFIATYTAQHQGVCPTLREIMANTGMKSTAGAHDILERLQSRKFLKRMKGMPRAIQITKTGKEYLNGCTNSPR